MRLPRAGGWQSGLRGLGIRPAEARQWRGLQWEEGGVGRALREPLGTVVVDGARYFFRNSSRSLGSSSPRRAEKRASSLRVGLAAMPF